MRKLAVIKDKEIRMIKELSSEDYDKLRQYIDLLGEFQNEIWFVNSVIDSFKECTQLIDSYLRKELSIQKFTDKLNRSVLNYLTSVRSFLDHWETYIKRTFGKGSEIEKCFKQSTAEQYDGEFSYRFVYLLRNYVQHCGMPISSVNSSYIDENTTVVNLELDRERLLSNFDWKENVKQQLKQMPAKFELMPHLTKMNECLGIIHSNLINQRFDNILLRHSLNLLEFQVNYRKYQGDFAIIEYDDKFHTPKMKEVIKQEGKMGLKIVYLPSILAKKLVLQFVEANQNNIKIFNLKGKYIGQDEEQFPRTSEPKENGIVSFSEGPEIIKADGDTWVRLMSKLSFLNQDGIDKLFAMYIRGGFSTSNKKELQYLYEKIYNILWKYN